MGSGRRWLVLLLALTLVRGVLYAVVIPPWQAPDENGHFEYAWLIAHLGRLPTRQDVSPTFERELLSSLYEWRYGEYIGRPLPEQMPPRLNDLPRSIFARRCRTALMERFSLAYLWQAAFIWPFQHQDLVLQLYVARFSSVVLNVLIVYLAWRIFEETVPQRPKLVAAMTAFVVFLPQHTFINASVNEGPLAELAACVVIYGWLRLFGRGVRVGNVAAIVGGTLIGLWTKKTAAFLLPFGVLVFMFLLSARIRGLPNRRRLGYLVLALILIVLLGGGALQTPVGNYLRASLERWWTDPAIYLENGRTNLGQTLGQTFDSFWARFGWMNVRAGSLWYIAIYLLTGAALEGWIWPRSDNWSIRSYGRRLLGAALGLVVVTWLAFVLLTSNGLAFSQGRYLFPAAVPVAFFLVGGWMRWFPERRQRCAGPSVLILMAALDAAAMSLTIWPFFYGS